MGFVFEFVLKLNFGRKKYFYYLIFFLKSIKKKYKKIKHDWFLSSINQVFETKINLNQIQF